MIRSYSSFTIEKDPEEEMRTLTHRKRMRRIVDANTRKPASVAQRRRRGWNLPTLDGWLKNRKVRGYKYDKVSHGRNIIQLMHWNRRYRRGQMHQIHSGDGWVLWSGPPIETAPELKQLKQGWKEVPEEPETEYTTQPIYHYTPKLEIQDCTFEDLAVNVKDGVVIFGGKNGKKQENIGTKNYHKIVKQKPPANNEWGSAVSVSVDDVYGFGKMMEIEFASEEELKGLDQDEEPL